MKMFKKTLSILLISVLLFTTLFSANAYAAASPEVKRLGGANRIETAINIAKEGWSAADNVVIANAYNFADALAGVSLAAALDAPILLTDASALSAGVANEITALKAKKVYILGGTASVSTKVENTLKSSGCSIKRIAGGTRFETSTIIAKELQSIAGAPTEIFIAYGFNYPDALAISPVAGATKNPVIYAPKSGALDASVAAYLRSSSCKKATILGGYASVDQSVEASIKAASVTAISRISGSSRYETALSICKAYSTALTGKDISVSTGESFPDALAGGAFAAKNKIPVLLVNNTAAVSGLKEFAGARSPARVYVFSGTAAVPDAVIRNIFAGGAAIEYGDNDAEWLDGWM